MGDERPDYAVLGLSEYSHRGNAAALLPGLENPIKKVQKYTLLALGRQEDFEDEEILENDAEPDLMEDEDDIIDEDMDDEEGMEEVLDFGDEEL